MNTINTFLYHWINEYKIINIYLTIIIFLFYILIKLKFVYIIILIN